MSSYLPIIVFLFCLIPINLIGLSEQTLGDHQQVEHSLGENLFAHTHLDELSEQTKALLEELEKLILKLNSDHHISVYESTWDPGYLYYDNAILTDAMNSSHLRPLTLVDTTNEHIPLYFFDPNCTVRPVGLNYESFSSDDQYEREGDKHIMGLDYDFHAIFKVLSEKEPTTRLLIGNQSNSNPQIVLIDFSPKPIIIDDTFVNRLWTEANEHIGTKSVAIGVEMFTLDSSEHPVFLSIKHSKEEEEIEKNFYFVCLTITEVVRLPKSNSESMKKVEKNSENETNPNWRKFIKTVTI